MSHHDFELANILHGKGYRLTAQRQMVLDAVCEAGSHASPEEIYKRVQEKSSAVNRTTVYRVLKFLRELDLLSATVDVNGRLEYEIAGEDPHLHFFCRSCGVNIEFSDEAFVTFAETLHHRYGFEVETDHITLTGLCTNCHEDSK